MKEFDDLIKSVSESFKAFTRLIEKVNEKLETASEKKEQPAAAPAEPQAVAEEKEPERKAVAKKPALKIAAKLKAASKPSPKKPAKKKPIKPEAGVSITETVQKVIEKNPGINFKSLLEKTGFETKQVQNALPQLKKAGKIKSEGKGVYFPASFEGKETPASEAQEQKVEETVE